VGDIHGDFDRFFDDIKDIRDSVFVLLGDAFIEHSTQKYITSMIRHERMLVRNNDYVCIMRGNMDDPCHFQKSSPMRQSLSDDVSRVILLQDYSIIEMCGCNILCVGGGVSFDRSGMKDVTYYPKEHIQKKSKDKRLINDISKGIDIVLTHMPPSCAFPGKDSPFYGKRLIRAYAMYDGRLEKDIADNRHILDELFDNVRKGNRLKTWVSSHYMHHNEHMVGKSRFISLARKEIKKII